MLKTVSQNEDKPTNIIHTGTTGAIHAQPPAGTGNGQFRRYSNNSSEGFNKSTITPLELNPVSKDKSSFLPTTINGNESPISTRSQPGNEYKQFQVKKTSSFSVPHATPDIKGLRGLRNLGNTCFMNSSIQCLSNLEGLTGYFLQGHHLNELNTTKGILKGELAKSYGNLMADLWSGSRCKEKSIKPTKLKSLIGECCVQFKGFEQQDSQEFLRFFLDALHEDLNKITHKVPYTEIKDIENEPNEERALRWWLNNEERNQSKIKDTFCGQLFSKIHCMTCGHESTTFDPFWDISVPIPDTGNIPCTLDHCFEAFTDTELLQGNNSVYCPNCKTHRDSQKVIKIQRLPPVLVVHLKRFLQTGYQSEKVRTEVNIKKKNFDVQPYCVEQPVILQKTDNQQPNATKYELSSVVNHIGSVRGGHYTATAQNGLTKKWYTFNDANVTEVKQEQICNSSAYVLFYSRI